MCQSLDFNVLIISIAKTKSLFNFLNQWTIHAQHRCDPNITPSPNDKHEPKEQSWTNKTLWSIRTPKTIKTPRTIRTPWKPSLPGSPSFQLECSKQTHASTSIDSLISLKDAQNDPQFVSKAIRLCVTGCHGESYAMGN